MKAPVAQSAEHLPRKQPVAGSIPARGPNYDFTGLTAPQRGVLAMQGWQPGAGQQPRPRTVAKLVERGLVVERDIVFCGVAMKAYEVPLDVHAAFCEWCSANGEMT